MKTILQTLFFFLLVTQICFAQLHKQTKESNLKTPVGIIDLKDKLLPIIDRNIHKGTSHQFEATNYKNKLQIGIDTPYMKSTSFPLPHDRFLPNEPKRNLSPTHRILSHQSQIYVIDTAIVINDDTTRHLYSYNAGNKRTSDLEQKLIGEYWMDTQRHTNTYDESNNMLTDWYETWDNGQWVNDARSTYTYDAQGNMLTDWREYWQNGQLTNSYRDTYTYDAQGNMLTYLIESGHGQLTNVSRRTYTYDAQGNMLTRLHETWDNGQWVIYYRYTYAYDSQGNMLTRLKETWDNGQWVNDARSTFIYDAHGNILTDWHETWDNGQWVNYYRYTYAYDAQGNMLTRLLETWDNGQWVNHYRYTYAYNAQGNMLTSFLELWNNGQLTNSYRGTYTYDAQGYITSFLYHRWSGSSWIPSQYGGRSGFEMIDIAGNEYHFYGHNFTFTYKLIITEVVSESGNAPKHYSLWQNYPNPFNPSTTIEFLIPKSEFVTLKIYNLLGQEVTTLISDRLNAGNYKYEFNTQNLSSGIYYYQLSAGEYKEVKKMILLQ